MVGIGVSVVSGVPSGGLSLAQGVAAIAAQSQIVQTTMIEPGGIQSAGAPALPGLLPLL